MPLITSISGIRGTIGGRQGENLTPADIIRFAAAYVRFLKQSTNQKLKIIIGRDSRLSGEMMRSLVVGVLLSQGVDVVDLGMATTPTVEMAVIEQKAQGGIIITASHNPQGWNGLKLLNAQGEFFSKEEGGKMVALGAASPASNDFNSVDEEAIGYYVFNPFWIDEHLRKILELSLVDQELVAARDFRIVVDGINSIGGKAVPELLRLLGVKLKNIIELNCTLDGRFAHKPEPLVANLTQIMDKVREVKADLGIVVDPDVDRLAFIDENGEMFGEEYTLVAVADYVLKNYDILTKQLDTARDKNTERRVEESETVYRKVTVSNLSSSRALRDVSLKYGGIYEPAAVGEVNVVQTMKETKAIIGGEGNGGVIYPALHYGRDALVGIALFLTALAKSGKKMSEFRREFPEYFMIKDKIELTPGLDLSGLLLRIKQDYEKIKQVSQGRQTSQGSQADQGSRDSQESQVIHGGEIKITDIDGVKIDWPDSWVHLRASNTEPIIRIYAEAPTEAEAAAKIKAIKDKILAYIK